MELTLPVHGFVTKRKLREGRPDHLRLEQALMGSSSPGAFLDLIGGSGVAK